MGHPTRPSSDRRNGRAACHSCRRGTGTRRDHCAGTRRRGEGHRHLPRRRSGRRISRAIDPGDRRVDGSSTLVVQKIVAQESEGALEIMLPVHAPTEVTFGTYPMTIRWADVVDDLRPAPGEPLARGVEVQLKESDSHEGRRVLRPGGILIDGARNWNFGFNYADPKALGLNIRLRAGESAKTVTFLDPVVEVHGP